MHNRDLIWTTSNGRRIKIRDITSNHLQNILNKLKIDKHLFVQKFGKNKVEKYLVVIKQEIRLRKLNRIKINNQDKKLF